MSCRRYNIRTAVVEDASDLYAVFADSIRMLTCEQYTPRQQVAWIQSAGPEYFRSLIALDQYAVWVGLDATGQVAGFAVLHHDDLSYLYVRPASARRGLGTCLLRKAEMAAVGQGIATLHLRSSLTARPFYERNGYRTVEEVVLYRQGVAIPTVVMYKHLR